MAASRSKVLFSPNGEYFVYSSPDGCLKIWETSSNCLKQEYTPSSHLSASCSTLTWCTSTKQYVSPEKKKKRSNHKVVSTITELNLIAMGTLSGDILLYSVTNGDLYTQMEGGHNDIVNDICCYLEGDSIFSCSNDQHIVRWSITKGKVKDKWRADRRIIHSICVIDENNLLSASSTIKWWDLERKAVLKEFTGHASEIFGLFPVNLSGNNSIIEGRYFLSVAVGDRVISAWQLKEDSDCNAVASFVVPDEPVHLSLSRNATKEQPLLVSVVTKSGKVHVFEHQLNGKCKKPLEPKVDIQIISSNTEGLKSNPVPLLANQVVCSSKSCQVVFGSFLWPTFETIEICDLKRDTCLIRQVSKPCAVTLEQGISKVKKPNKGVNVKHLAPGYMTENVPVKRKKSLDLTELSLEERFKIMYPDDLIKGKDEESAVTSDSIVHLILQCLQSEDTKLLDAVFHCKNEELITKSVKLLPLKSIYPFLKILSDRICKRNSRDTSSRNWFDTILDVHKGFVISCPDIPEVINPVFQCLWARTENYPALSAATRKMRSMVLHADRYKVKNMVYMSNYEFVSPNHKVHQDGISSGEEMDESDVEEPNIFVSPNHKVHQDRISPEEEMDESDIEEPNIFVLPNHKFHQDGISSEEEMDESDAEEPYYQKNRILSEEADSMMHLIFRGLQSEDCNRFETVFQCENEELITESVKQIPLKFICPFLKVLRDRICKYPSRDIPYLRWFKPIVNVHKDFLNSCPDISEIINPVFQHHNAKVRNYQTLQLRLVKKIECFLPHLNRREKKHRKNRSRDKFVATNHKDHQDGLSSEEELDESDVEEDGLENDETSSSERNEEEGVMPGSDERERDL